MGKPDVLVTKRFEKLANDFWDRFGEVKVESGFPFNHMTIFHEGEILITVSIGDCLDLSPLPEIAEKMVRGIQTYLIIPAEWTKLAEAMNPAALHLYPGLSVVLAGNQQNAERYAVALLEKSSLYGVFQKP